MTNHDPPLEALCGERAMVSAFTSGHLVGSWSEGLLKTGKITWMTPASLDPPWKMRWDWRACTRLI
jgi:hypothetical protein